MVEERETEGRGSLEGKGLTAKDGDGAEGGGWFERKGAEGRVWLDGEGRG